VKAGSAAGQLVPRERDAAQDIMNITIKDLLDAGVHFGHQLRRFNPKSKKFVFDNRHGISVIDLEKTYARLEIAAKFIEETVAGGKEVLLVGTKRQAKDLIKEAAIGCNMPYATSRWLGGTMTNFVTVRRSIEKYKQYLQWEGDGTLEKMHNKESSAIRREMSRMNRNFEGIVDLEKMPGALFVVDTKTEDIAVAEANRLKIPVVALVDTNSDPSKLEYPIPGNDDSLKSIRVIVEVIMDAIQAGLAQRAQPDAIQPRTVKPVIESPTVEDQVPVTAIRSEDEEGDAVPESFSTDADENK
jgi:small subunit ribosomal protein S2